jgi:hypothetical protein
MADSFTIKELIVTANSKDSRPKEAGHKSNHVT